MVGCCTGEKKLPAYEIWQPVGIITQTCEAWTFQIKPERVAERKGKGRRERKRGGRVYDALKWSEEKYPFIFMKRQNSPLPFFLLSNSSGHHFRNTFSVLLFKKRIKSQTQNKKHILRGNDAPVIAHKKEKLTNLTMLTELIVSIPNCTINTVVYTFIAISIPWNKPYRFQNWRKAEFSR